MGNIVDYDYLLLFQTFYDNEKEIIFFPENITSTKVDAIVENGNLKIEVPKQRPKTIEETKIKIK
jgi:HSP20 family molecular chaperone IbpA